MKVTDLYKSKPLCKCLSPLLKRQLPLFGSVSKVFIVDPRCKDKNKKTWKIIVAMLIELNFHVSYHHVNVSQGMTTTEICLRR